MEKSLVEGKIKEIAQKIVKEFKPEKIILFGSWAWGNPGPDSDIDLLIVKDSNKKRIERQIEIRKSLPDSNLPMDILVYTPSEIDESIHKNRNLFLEDVIANGKVLYAAH